MFMASGHLYRQAVVLGNLASASFLLGDMSAAERWCDQAIERTDTLADVEGSATNRTVLGLIELWTDRWPTARANFESAWRTGLEVGATIVALDAATWLGIGLVEYGDAPKDVVTRPVRRHGRRCRDGRSSERRAGAVGPGIRPAVDRRDGRLAEADEAASRAAAVLRDSGVEASIPQCTALRIVIAQGGGLDPTRAAAEAAALVAELDRPAIDVSMRSAHLLGQLWELLAGSRATRRRSSSCGRPCGRTWTGASWARRSRSDRPDSSRSRRSPAWSRSSTRPDVDLHLSLSGGGDLTTRLYRELRRAVRDGRLRPGDRLPPTRDARRPARAVPRHRRHRLRTARRGGLPGGTRRGRHLRRAGRAAGGCR